jgi:hypothetical protein
LGKGAGGRCAGAAEKELGKLYELDESGR